MQRQRRQIFAFAGAALMGLSGALAQAQAPMPYQSYRNASDAAQGQRLAVEVLGGPRRARNFPIFYKTGRWYVGGQEGQPYRLQLRNQTGGRLLVVVSVDGLNVLSGEAARAQQSGYIVNAYDTVTVEGWRKSLDEVAQFVFTGSADAYAERTGQGGNVGLLGFAVFEEYQPPAIAYEDHPRARMESRAGGPAAMPAPSAPPLGTGHGERIDSPVYRAEFQRTSARPVEVLRLQYASLIELEQRGIAQRPGGVRPHAAPPDAFPGDRDFVPDPPRRR
ncbi:MAG: hypothetical protein K2Q11_10025 [Burkholderiaceae bacterium]|nr:hypothetical protein [Burkholderiaceae bacterium]